MSLSFIGWPGDVLAGPDGRPVAIALDTVSNFILYLQIWRQVTSWRRKDRKFGLGWRRMAKMCVIWHLKKEKTDKPSSDAYSILWLLAMNSLLPLIQNTPKSAIAMSCSSIMYVSIVLCGGHTNIFFYSQTFPKSLHPESSFTLTTEFCRFWFWP
jgi:hypothetical protein